MAESEFLALESRSVRILARDANQIAARVERPGVVRALEAPGVAASFAAYEGAPMSTGVEQHPDHAIVAAHQDYGASHDAPGAEVARVGHFGLVPGVNPALFENPLLLEVKVLGFGEDAPIDAKYSGGLVVDYEVFHGDISHISSPRIMRCPGA
jgi:hypothetical protein